MMQPPEVFDLTVWRINEDKTISEACVVEMIFSPDTEMFHLLLDEENIEELIERWLGVGDGAVKNEVGDSS